MSMLQKQPVIHVFNPCFEFLKFFIQDMGTSICLWIRNIFGFHGISPNKKTG